MCSDCITNARATADGTSAIRMAAMRTNHKSLVTARTTFRRMAPRRQPCRAGSKHRQGCADEDGERQVKLRRVTRQRIAHLDDAASHTHRHPEQRRAAQITGIQMPGTGAEERKERCEPTARLPRTHSRTDRGGSPSPGMSFADIASIVPKARRRSAHVAGSKVVHQDRQPGFRAVGGGSAWESNPPRTPLIARHRF